MTHKDIFTDTFPQDKQIGGSHYKKFSIQPYEFISKNKGAIGMISNDKDFSIEQKIMIVK